jgi:hypothetical protein
MNRASGLLRGARAPPFALPDRDMAHNSHDPYDAPPLRGLGPVQATLRVFVALQCWGYAAAHLHFGAKSAFARVLESEFYLSPGETAFVDQVAAIVLAICGMMCLLRPAWPVLLGLFFGDAVFVASKAWLGEGGHPAIIVARHAAIILSPLILGCADFWPNPRKFSLGFWIAIAGIMQFAIVVSFIGNGLEGLIESHQGGDLVRVATGTVEMFTRQTPSPEHARIALAMASAIQLGAGLSLLLNRSRQAAGVAAVVGVWMAGSYSLGLGMAGYPRMLTHMIHGGLAAALYLFWSSATRQGEISYVPDLPVQKARGGH